MTTGKVLNFDEARGYGFISSSSTNEDVFMHVNDLLDDKSLLRPGVRVEFDLETGDRGLKASGVRILDGHLVSGHEQRRSPQTGGVTLTGDEDTLCDVLSIKDYRNELTEALLASAPEMSAAQIVLVRKRVMEIAESHNWVES